MDTDHGAVFRKRGTPPQQPQQGTITTASPASHGRPGKGASKPEGNSYDSLLLVAAFLIPMILFEITGNPLVYLYRQFYPNHTNPAGLLRATAKTTSAAPLPKGSRSLKTPFIPNQPLTWVTAPPLPGSTSVDPYAGRNGGKNKKKERNTNTNTNTNRALKSTTPDETYLPPITEDQKVVAYVVPLGPCKQIQDTIVDAALVLRHSIHQQSRRNPVSGSTWDYRMFAMISGNIDTCRGPALEALGYTILQPGAPINTGDIQNDYLRKNLGDIPDGGISQFDILMAHKKVPPPHTLLVIMNWNTLLHKPLDVLLDSMVYPQDSPEGQTARQELQSLQERPSDPLPERIHHYFVRDYAHTGYGRTPVAMTPGFFVSRRDPEVATLAFSLIHSGSYREGTNPQSGWGSSGYTTYWRGGMGLAGFVPYLMEAFYPQRGVELKSCWFHHNGMDNRLRNVPRYHPGMANDHGGDCRSGEKDCGDCTTTPVESLYSIYYDNTCFKPWECMGEGQAYEGKYEHDRESIDTRTTTLEHCLELQSIWHGLRQEVEELIQTRAESMKLPLPTTMTSRSTGSYHPNTFVGHCSKAGGYLRTDLKLDLLKQLPALIWGETPSATATTQ